MRIYSEAWRRGWEWAKLKVVISDGAVWIWKPAALGLPDLSLLCRAPGGRARHRSGDERLIPSRDRKGPQGSGCLRRVNSLPRRTEPWPRPDRRLCTEERALHPRSSIANACFHGAPSVSDRVRRLPAGSSARLAYALELVHDSLGSGLGRHNGVHMVGSYVRSQQIPTAVRAVPLDGRQYYRPARFVEHIGLLEHFPAFCHDAL